MTQAQRCCVRQQACLAGVDCMSCRPSYVAILSHMPLPMLANHLVAFLLFFFTEKAYMSISASQPSNTKDR